MKKVKILIAVLVIISLLIPFNAFAEGVANTIQFDELEGLLMGRSQQIRDNNNSFGTGMGSSSSAATLEEKISYIRGDLMAGLDEVADAPLYYLLDQQAKSLEAQLASLSGVDDKNQVLLWGTEMKNYVFIFGVESSFISIKNMDKQIEALKSRVEAMKKQVAVMKLRLDLKMVTELTYKQTENGLKTLENQLAILLQTRKKLIEEMNLNLGQDADIELNLADINDVTDFQISSIDLTQDYELAALASPSIQTAAKGDDDQKEDDARRQFKADFYRTYQNVLDKKQAADLEASVFAVAEWNKKTADIKFTLGMLSPIDYEEAKNSYLDAQTKYTAAKNALFQAFHQYRWAKRGYLFI